MPTVNAKLLSYDRHIHTLLVSPSGGGKTCIGAGFPGKYFCLDFDDRIKGILGAPWLKAKIDAGEIEYEHFPLKRDGKVLGYDNVINTLEKVDIRVRNNEIQIVQLSSISSLIRFLLNQSVNGNIVNAPNHYSIGGVSLAQKQDYNYTAVTLANIIFQNLKSFKCHVIVDAHLKDKIIASPTTEDPERTIVVGRTLKAPGQLPDEIPTWFDETWELELDETVKSSPPRRFCLFQSKIAKTSFPIKHRVEFTGKNLYDVIQAELSKSQNEVKK